MQRCLIISLLSLCFSTVGISQIIAGIDFGDSESAVIKKLNSSPLVSTKLDKSMFARVGLNGSYETTNTLRSLSFHLYFDWDYSAKDKSLTEVSLRSQKLPLSTYSTRLKYAWQHAINLLTSIHGKPVGAGEYPALSDLTKDQVQYSTYWKTNEGHLYLGIGDKDGKLILNICFRKDKLGG